MSALLTLIASLGELLARSAAKVGLSAAGLALLGPLAPALTGLAQFVGSCATALGEILSSLSKSAEGRVALALAATVAGFLFMRFHYIEEGKTLARAEVQAAHKPCPTKAERRGR